MAPVALNELDLASDRLGVRIGVLRLPQVALLTLTSVRGVVTTKRGEAAVAGVVVLNVYNRSLNTMSQSVI